MSDFTEKLNSYFKMKEKYEENLLAKKLSIYNDQELSKGEKKKALRSIPVKCINCKKSGGTKFKYEDRTYSATCGNMTSPCNLNIALKIGQVVYVPSVYESIMKDIDVVESGIIELKLKYLFGFKNEETMMSEFQDLKDELKFSQNILNNIIKVIDQNIKINERESAIKEETYELMGYLEEMKLLTDEFIVENNVSLIQEALENYIENILPTIENIRMFNNVYQNVEKIVHDGGKKGQNQIQLIKRKNTIEMEEFTIHDNEVISYVIK